MDPVPEHQEQPTKSFDGGLLDCGSGLLLLIRKHIDPMDPGALLEIRSSERSVQEDLPSWCRLTGNSLVSWTRDGDHSSFLVRKAESAIPKEPRIPSAAREAVSRPQSLEARAVPAIPNLAVMGIGSWPRPHWMRRAIHDHMSGRMEEDEFQATADDAVRLATEAQKGAGAHVLTDGEQRRDSYASFVGGLLENAQLIPLADLTAMVDDPAKFVEELKALDVPATEVRHPVVFGPLRRTRPLAVHEAQFVQSLSPLPVKVALPGPYLLTRTMWLDCLLERAYATREELGKDIVRVLREELEELLRIGVAVVQFDEPVLTEVVFTGAKAKRSFMCGALSEKGDAPGELAFARDLFNAVTAGFPEERLAIHICRGNWTKDESALLSGSYTPLIAHLKSLHVGTYFLETCTPRAGELAALQALPEGRRIGLGVVNPRSDHVETPEEILTRLKSARAEFGDRPLWLNSDCGFATFADNPVASAQVAASKIASMVEARRRFLAGNA